ncbi:hypothetical protein VDG1235_4123 [Verrucomicrobiia bacterium DG1235]|nr:hypothetical protein VDG1235_4123 [Verrucomicrobiae bacterium DG1235]
MTLSLTISRRFSSGCRKRLPWGESSDKAAVFIEKWRKD